MLKVTVLTDNTAKENLTAEWGFSAYIEYDNHKYLLDAGQSEVFIRNAEILGVNLAEVETAVLSHGHYDHCDGFDAFFGINEKSKLLVSDKLSENGYHLKGAKAKYIGISRGFVGRNQGRLVKVSGVTRVQNGVYIVPHSTKGLFLKGLKAKMLRRSGLLWLPENFGNEQTLVFETESGLMIFSSCSHGGVKNILREVKDAFGEKKIFAFVGGLHLHEASDRETLAVAEALEECGVRYLYTGHCTGERAISLLKSQNTFDTVQIFAGLTVKFG